MSGRLYNRRLPQVLGARVPRADERVIVGLMAGNSLDGVSAAVLATTGHGMGRVVEFLYGHVHPISDALRQELFAFHYPQSFTANDLLSAHLGFGEELAQAALEAIDGAGVRREEVAVLGVQAANLIHAVAGREGLSSSGHLEIGELAVVAERTGLLVVGDLRPSDIAVGGQGAPLSPYVDYLLFANRDGKSRAIQNIGGIANVTFLPARCTLDDVISFDCGPGNMVIDRLLGRFTKGAEAYDEDGRRAARGEVIDALLRTMLEHPFLSLSPPKTSRGPEEFGEAFVDQILARAAELGGAGEDSIVATATQFSVECMASHYERFFPYLPSEIVVTGGGAHNLELIRRLGERLPKCEVRTHDQFGIPVDAREASTWAILADDTVRGIPANVPAATGAASGAILGKIVVPSRLAGRVRVGFEAASAIGSSSDEAVA